eukprot:250502-Chlamydomonas_euryale.AAC.26
MGGVRAVCGGSGSAQRAPPIYHKRRDSPKALREVASTERVRPGCDGVVPAPQPHLRRRHPQPRQRPHQC